MTKETQEFISSLFTTLITALTAYKQPLTPILNQILFNALVRHDAITTEIFRYFNYAPEARITELQGFVDSL